MQLQMTAPLDIGLDFADDALKGDVFDLTRADGKVVGSDEDSDDEGDAPGTGEGSESEEDSGAEGERKVVGLEDELDGLYEQYRERMAERDLKFKAKESRRKDKHREEWSGIRKDEDGDESEGNSEGGWDVAQAAKGRGEDDASSGEESESEVEEKAVKKRKLEDGKKLVTKLEEPKAKGAASKAAQLWFSQDLFKGVDAGEGDEEEEASESEVEEVEEPEVEEEDEVRLLIPSNYSI